jgi:glucose/arabinose dehydrogenase
MCRFPKTGLLPAGVIAVMLCVAGSSAIRAQPDAPFDPATFSVRLEPTASGFAQPVHVADANDGSGRLFVVERGGTIRIVEHGTVRPDPFLDITDIVESTGSEQGLLSVAFPPNYAESGQFYVYYTAHGGAGVGDDTIARYRVSESDPNVADRTSGTVLLAIPDERRNHNGGLLLFGPDGYLYAGLGDGGGGGDPAGNGQNPRTLLGSILRIDVSARSDRPYAIPPDNPFADGAAGAPEIWVWGLRNPWRYSFDRLTGDLSIGDVGQGAIEEIDWLPTGQQAGVNLGWNVMEGTSCYGAETCDQTGLTLPIAEYSHGQGCSVVGGYVYRGEASPALRGVYLFADYCSGLLWGLGRDQSGAWTMSKPIETGLNVSSFGEDAAGELYVVDLGGGLYHLTAGD